MGLNLARLVEGVGRVRATPRKSEKLATIAALLGEARGREIELVALYLSGSLPQGRIGLGYRALRSAHREGPREGAPLELLELDEAFHGIAADVGAGSAERRLRRLATLLARAEEGERRFLVELILGELRQGALEGVVLEAIAKAAGLPAADVRQAAMFAPDLGQAARTALEDGAAGLARFSLRPLSPVAPMLASSAAGPEEALGRMGEAAFEHKLDGARIQLHRSGEEVRVFTRQLQDVTERVPELVELARARLPQEIVLEGEAIALRPDGRPRPFQETMRRFGRSKGVESARQERPLSVFFFDCLFLAGEGSLVGLPYAERFARLERSAPHETLLPRLVTRSADEASRFLEQALHAGHEGVMAKALDAPYVAGQRGFHWMKLKSAHTLDLVVLAVEWGSGRRKGWLSNLHLGARDVETGGYAMLGKTFKGLTDATLKWQTEKLLSLEARRDDWTIYVRPELVVEIAFNDVQESPRYPSGFALRFARVKRYREDKPASEADSLETIREIFRRQRQ